MKEIDLTLSVDKESFKQGETATLTVEGSKGDFLKNLTGVALMKEGKVVKNVLYKGAEGSEAAYYEIDKSAADGNVLKLTLTAQEVEAGDYTVSLTANYYEEPLTAEFKVTAKDAETVTTPKFDSYMLNEADGYYRVSFTGATGDELKAYLNSVETVMVGSKEYTKQNSSSGNLEENKFRVVASNPAYGSSEYDKLDLPASAVTEDEVTVVLKAKEGTSYADVTFKIAKTSSGGGTEQPETKTAPVVNEITENASDGIYEVSFKTEKAQDTRNYLAAITEVTVGGVPYEASENTPASGSKQFRSKSEWLDLRVLQLGSGGFATDGKATKIVVKATGYEALEFTYPLASSGGSDGGTTTPGTPETPDNGGITVKECKLKKDWNGTFYEMRFNGFDNENDLASFVDSITEVQVGNDKKFTKATLSFSFSETEFVTVTENYSVGIKFHESSLADVKDGTTITIKGKVNGKDVTITYSLEKE